jgi:uncharacterized membrane protein
MVQALAKFVTLQEFLALPETEPASEYIDGCIIQKPMPQGEHSVIQTELPPAINLILKPKKIARAFSELRCTFDGRSIIPDISVFTWDRIPRNESGGIANVFAIAPDWTIEILSPDQGLTLLENLISTIQGIVDIQQTSSERRVNSTIAIVGFGLAVSQIAASVIIAQKDPKNENVPFYQTHAFIDSLVVTVIIVISCMFLWWTIEVIRRLILSARAKFTTLFSHPLHRRNRGN